MESYQAGTTRETVQRYAAGGLSVFPLRLDGTKSPFAPWNEFRTRICSENELDRLFARSAGIAIVCGLISEGLEVIDFDAGEFFAPWFEQVDTIASKLPIIDTPSGGAHVYYRCCEIGGNYKIAVDPTRAKKTLIETRGEGGYVVAPGSPRAVHPNGRTYCQFSGPRLPVVPTITPAERSKLWAAARMFDKASLRQEYIEQEKLRRLAAIANSNPVDPTAPWNDFQRRASWDEILLPHGWRTRGNGFWTRPGKQYGTSARVVQAADGAEVLTVFSGNAGPLSPTGSYRTLNKFAAYTALNHGGNKRLAAKELRNQGFGGK